MNMTTPFLRLNGQKMKGYNLAAGRTPEQIEKMKMLQEKGICAFCPEYFIEHHDNPIEFETTYWIVAKNDYPYDHTSLHLLLVAKEHVQTVTQLSLEARNDFMQTLVRVEEHFKLPSYAIGMRVGDFHYNGGSVDHIHAHLVVGDSSDPKNHQKVRFKMSSVPENK